MNDLVLNVYDKRGKEVVKTATATTYDLMFGTVQKLMELLKIEDVEDNLAMLKILHEAWDEICEVLSDVFPDITEDEWRYVKVKELLPAIIAIAKLVVADFMVIPVDPKN